MCESNMLTIIYMEIYKLFNIFVKTRSARLYYMLQK